jgi:hypothetical protein
VKPDAAPQTDSPYRRSPSVLEPAPGRPAPHRRIGRGPALTALAMAGSLIAHGAIMAASVCSEPPPAAAATEPAPRKLTSPGYPTPFLMQLDPISFWPPPPAVEACFDFRTLERMRPRYAMYWVERSNWRPIKFRSWSEIVVSDEGHLGRDERAWYLEELVQACSWAASIAGFREDSGALLQIARREDGSTLTTASPRDGAALDDRLRCCLLQAEEALLPSLRPGASMRYEARFYASSERQ